MWRPASGIMSFFQTEPGSLGLHGLVALVLAGLVFLIPFFWVPRLPQPAKLMAYECGFDPISSSRRKFDVQFYLVGILFVIFDLEVVLFFPWPLSLAGSGPLGLLAGLFFLAGLLVGLWYEWSTGSLDWLRP